MDNRNNALNLLNFWELPEKEWRNITKYDFRFYYQSDCTCSKNDTHQAYSQDIQGMLKKVEINSNSYKALKSCEGIAKNARNNHANKYFWNHEASKIAKMVFDELFAEKELEIMEKVTAATTLCSYNQKSLSTSNNSLQQDVSSNVNMDSISEGQESNDNAGKNHSQKRKQQNDEGEATTVPAKRPNQQETLTEKLIAYKQKIMHDAARGFDFNLETNLSELVTRYTRDHFTDEILNKWHKGILDTLIINVEEEDLNIAKSLDDLVYFYGADIYDCLGSKDFHPEIFCLPQLEEKQNCGEVTNIVPDNGNASEVKRVQPDAMICEIDQLSWSCTFGYGEAKLAEPNLNTGVLANDLLRLAIMTTKAIGGSEMRSVLAFQIHGKTA
ncbi:hypothetical protein G6F56_007672 [Rhizopus delemar]|nr:hypothetical protein G6F56_007672 [Rhizopus delemar]